MQALRDEFGVSERRACRVAGQHRSTQRRTPAPPADDEAQLRQWLRDFAAEHPRWGWKRAYTTLRAEGWTINRKRVRERWRDEGLKLPQKRKKKRLTGIGVHLGPMCPIAPDAIWACDFQFDRTIDGRQVKLLNIVDEFTREALTIVADHSIDADTVVATLDVLALRRGGPPAFIRFDNGPEFVSHAVAEWAKTTGTGALFIDPGSPWQNAWIESFNGRLRDELLDLWQFDSLLEARVLIEQWRIEYNTVRPHSAHDGLAPETFAAHWRQHTSSTPIATPQLA